MLTLLSECHFWTSRDDKIRIKDYDLGAFKYSTNKRDFDGKNLIALGKKEYNEKRNGTVVLTNRKSTRLKDNIKKFEELLRVHKVIKTDWKNGCVVQILLSNGILVHICVNIFTGDILKMAFDKFFVGKLAAEFITDAVFSRQNILLAYNTNQITIVHLQKPNMKRSTPEKIANMDPKIYHVLIPGSSERKLSRHLVVNRSFDLIIVWTKSSQNELFPWRPTFQDQDRANMHVFKLRAGKMEPIGFCWTENDPICTQFLRSDENKVITVEQKVSRKGEISADICFYSIGKGRLQKKSSNTIPIGSQICCYGFSPDQQKLFLGTIDRCICIYDIVRQKTKFLPKIDIIPIICAWHPDSTIILIGNNKSQFQCFDFALNQIANQLTSENVTPGNLLDISYYFVTQPSLLSASFSLKPDRNTHTEEKTQTECFLLLVYENGPIACLRFFSSTGMQGDGYNLGVRADVLISKYLSNNNLEKAVNLLLFANWETCGAMCLFSLHKIVNYVLSRNEVKRSRNDLLKRALRSFTDQLNEETKDEYGDQVVDLRRRFFFFLLRHKLFNECLEIARIIVDYDLFMDLFNCTKSDPNLISITHESYHQAEQIVSQTEKETKDAKLTNNSRVLKNEDDTTSSSSFTSCTDFNDHPLPTDEQRRRSISTNSEFKNIIHHQRPKSSNDCYLSTQMQNLKVKRYKKNREEIDSIVRSLKNYVPPLKSIKSPINNASNIKINNNPRPLEIPESPNVSNGCFRLIKKSKESPPKQNKVSNKDEVDALSNLSIVSSQNFKNNYEIAELVPPIPERKKSLEFSAWSHPPDQTLGIPAITQVLPALSAPISFQSSVLTSPHQLIPRPSTIVPMARSSASPECLPIRNLVATDFTRFQQPSVSQQQQLQLNNTIGMTAFNQSEISTENSYTPKYYQHPLVSGTIPATVHLQPPNLQIQSNVDTFMKNRKPAASILSNSSNGSGGGNSSIASNSNPLCKKDSSERNKVKFSDTVHVAVVPEIPRKEKPIPTKRNGLIRKNNKKFVTNPQRELADSLPLCNPNDEYLKDFNPVTEDEIDECNGNYDEMTENSNNNNNINNNINNNNNNEDILDSNNSNGNNNGSTIKVVHFGVV